MRIKILAAALVAFVFSSVAISHAAITRIAGPEGVVSEPSMFVRADVAFDTVSGVYLAVWGTQPPVRTKGQFLSAAGVPIGGPFVIADVAGWPRLTFGGGKFLVSYTNILGPATHQRAAKFVTYQGGSPVVSSQIIIDTWGGGSANEGGVAYSNGRYLVTWWNFNSNPPQSYAKVLDGDGNVLAGPVTLTMGGDGQTDPDIACDPSRARCLVIGDAWGVFSGAPSTWGVVISDSTAAPVQPTFYVAAGPIQKENTITFSTAGDRYIIAFSRFQTTIYGTTFSGAAAGADGVGAVDAWKSAVESPDGVGYGRPRLVYNPLTQNVLLAIKPWVPRTAAMEVDAAGNPIQSTFQLAPWASGEIHEVAPAADSHNARFIIADNQAFLTMRMSLYSASGGAPAPPPPPTPCTYSLSSAGASVAPGGGGGSVTVTPDPGSCSWSASSNAGWLTVSNPSGTGTAAVNFNAAANVSGAPRSATLTISGRTFTVNQTACSYSLNPTSINIGSPNAEAGTIFVTTQSGCTWSTADISGYVSFTARTGVGTRSVGINITANPSTQTRSWSTTIAGLEFFVTQSGRGWDAGMRARENARADFNGDSLSDVLVENLSSGAISAWFLNGHIVQSVQPLSQAIRDTEWRIVGTADFNADGQPDIVWQHLSAGYLYVWFMNGTTRIGGGHFSIPQLMDARWRGVGIGDFNADGKPDVLWQHPDGWIAAWLLNGLTVQSSVPLTPGAVMDTQWRIAGVADFNGDGSSDLVWQHSGRGEIGLWLMNGLTRQAYFTLNPGAVANRQWQIASVIDANGDNSPDIVWHHPTAGWAAVWYMAGTVRIGAASFTSNVPTTGVLSGAK